ncbi:hypothetical protein FisN_32Lh066 [Fistulifera solaris]|jgi:hypothetical protein|uniref:Uncharacterized protein n=1 Tax=Fistulifera solaris TaxID=1519565 RepID=A0A1Z5JG98_FISSO|nr:hypothetical protein FisN_32Lh066 [Fistulifera solaris]|eukprot:GAX12912.1 hypothetical protein FisN_32Lh066 [Fistulifera solaris]
MFGLKRDGQTKENKLDYHFGSEEFGGSGTAFWDDTDRRGRLRRSTSFESILETTTHVDHDAAVTKVVGSMRNLMLQSKSNLSSIGNKQSFSDTHTRQAQPKSSVIVGSVSHMLLQGKNTFAATGNQSFNTLDQLSHARKGTSYKLDSSGEFKYPSPKKTENNMFFDLIDKKHEKRVSMEKEDGFGNASEADTASDEVNGYSHVQRISNEERRPTTHLLRQKSDSSLFFGSREDTVINDAKPDPRFNMQLNTSEHSLHQRRSRRRFGIQKFDRSKEDLTTSSGLAVKRAGSDPTLESRSRRTTSRKKSDTPHHLGHQHLHHKSRQLLSGKKETTSNDCSAPSNSHTRGRRIVIGLSKGEDDDDMHATTDKPKRKRRPRIDMAERGNSSSRSSLNFNDDDDQTDHEEKEDSPNSNDASFAFLERAPVEDKLQTSNHSIDILDDTPQNELIEAGHRSSVHKPRNEKERRDTRHGLRKASSDKEQKLRKHGSQSHSETVNTLSSSQHEKLESLKHKLKFGKDGTTLSAFESCDLETTPVGCRGRDRNHFSFHFGDDFEFSPLKKPDEVIDSNDEADGEKKEPSTVADESASLIKLINTLDFPVPIPTDGEDDQLGKSHSNHTASSKTSKRSKRPPSSLVRASSKKSLSRASTKKTEPNDSNSSLSLGLSSGSLDGSF